MSENSTLEQVKQRAGELVVQVREKSGPALMRVMDAIGADSQKRMAAANDLMSQSVGSLLKGLDGKSPTGEKLLELRSAMDEINPHSLHNAWWFSWMPAGIKRQAISRFVRRYEPMQKHVDGILNGLRAAVRELAREGLRSGDAVGVLR